MAPSVWGQPFLIFAKNCSASSRTSPTFWDCWESAKSIVDAADEGSLEVVVVPVARGCSNVEEAEVEPVFMVAVDGSGLFIMFTWAVAGVEGSPCDLFSVAPFDPFFPLAAAFPFVGHSA